MADKDEDEADNHDITHRHTHIDIEAKEIRIAPGQQFEL